MSFNPTKRFLDSAGVTKLVSLIKAYVDSKVGAVPTVDLSPLEDRIAKVEKYLSTGAIADADLASAFDAELVPTADAIDAYDPGA